MRLTQETEAAFYKPFRWGQHDCALFVADCIDRMTGSAVAGQYRGRYTTAAGARRITGRSLEAFVERIAGELGLPEVSPLKARRGDVVVFDDAHGPTLGVVVGRHIASPGPKHLVLDGMTRARRAWKVG